MLQLICPFFSFFLLPCFLTEIFVTFFSGTVKNRKLKLNTNMNDGSVSCILESGC